MCATCVIAWRLFMVKILWVVTATSRQRGWWCHWCVPVCARRAWHRNIDCPARPSTGCLRRLSVAFSKRRWVAVPGHDVCLDILSVSAVRSKEVAWCFTPSQPVRYIRAIPVHSVRSHLIVTKTWCYIFDNLSSADHYRIRICRGLLCYLCMLLSHLDIYFLWELWVTFSQEKPVAPSLLTTFESL